MSGQTRQPTPSRAAGSRNGCRRSVGRLEQIAGRLCVPSGARIVQLLVHGYSWGRYYWDFPYEPERYSYVRAANAAGFATLAIDRLGVGDSSRPASDRIDVDSNVSVVHQVVQALRRGDLGPAFDKVVLVGHSFGTIVSWIAAGTHQDVDGIVATAATHQPNLANLVADTFNFYPALLDPKFAGSGLDVGYLTALPGKRTNYYQAGNVDPAVVELDEQLKQTGTIGERLSALPAMVSDASQNINVPVLAVVGQQEPEFCNGIGAADCSSSEALAAGERAFYGPGAVVDALVVPDAKHNVTLHRSAPQTLASIQEWVARRIAGS